MRLRKDFFTLCPECESRISLTLAAQLQATRLGTSCLCECGHEWVCISEWIYRDNGFLPEAELPRTPGVLPRPHLPVFQPPTLPAIAQSPAGLPRRVEESSAVQSPIPLPHVIPAARDIPTSAQSDAPEE